MTLSRDPIRVDGLRDVQAGLKAVEDGAQKQLRDSLNRAAQIVVDAAQAKVPTRSGKARLSIKAQSGQREAKIIGGQKKVPYYGWLDFGGAVGKKDSVRRPVLKEGRYLYPAFGEHREDVLNIVADELAALSAAHGLPMEVTHG